MLSLQASPNLGASSIVQLLHTDAEENTPDEARRNQRTSPPVCGLGKEHRNI